MKLNKILDLKSRPITNMELVTRYLFGNNFPKEFNPGDYLAGDYVYQIKDNDVVTVYYCKSTGHYDVIDDNNWVLATIPSMIKSFIDDTVLSGTTPESSELKNFLSELLRKGKYEYDTYTRTNLIVSESCIMLPIPASEFNHHYYDIDLFINGKRKSRLKNEYTIDGPEITLSEPINDDDKITICIINKCDTAARLIYTYEAQPNSVKTTTDAIVVSVTVPNHVFDKSVVFDLYSKGKYISQNNYTYIFDRTKSIYTISVDKTTGISTNSKDIVINFTCALSSEITIVKNDIDKVAVNDPNRFQLDMRYTDFNDISIIYNSYVNGSIIPNTDIVSYNSTVHITNQDYYLNKGDTYTISYKNIIINSIFDDDDELTKNMQEVIYVSQYQADTHMIPIPFVDYDKNASTLLVFKGNGYLVSSTRYYIKDNILTFYPHDTSLVAGDKIIFQILNNDYSINSYMKTVTISQFELDNGVKLPTLGHIDELFDVLVFTTSGNYIPKDMYDIQDRTLIFNDNFSTLDGDTLEIVMFDYITDVTNTWMKLYHNRVSNNRQLMLPFAYNGETDNIILFQDNGMYIDKSRYTISTNGIIELQSGTQFDPTSCADVLLVRRLNDSVFVNTIGTIRK